MLLKSGDLCSDETKRREGCGLGSATVVGNWNAMARQGASSGAWAAGAALRRAAACHRPLHSCWCTAGAESRGAAAQQPADTEPADVAARGGGGVDSWLRACACAAPPSAAVRLPRRGLDRLAASPCSCRVRRLERQTRSGAAPDNRHRPIASSTAALALASPGACLPSPAVPCLPEEAALAHDGCSILLATGPVHSVRQFPWRSQRDSVAQQPNAKAPVSSRSSPRHFLPSC